MEKFDELLTELTKLKIIQKSGDWAEDIPLEMWNEHFMDNFTFLSKNLKDVHRWYETSIVTIEIHGRFLGIHCITNILSESMMAEDCYHQLEFFEMEMIMSPTYIIKE